jgi:A/G-specific adenine glycosylase
VKRAGPSAGFVRRLIAWQAHSGRHALPWQQTRDAYRIWLSEVMLQQTQVVTVIPYYRRFVERFPTVEALARAGLDDVLALWSGLGYYSRGRNLHRAAREVLERHAGRFPTERHALEALPGVGRSTAAAIAVFSAGAREAILDGNVKRVLARHFAVAGFPGGGAIEKQLWSRAESLLPDDGLERYTQALMDLGATVCTRSRPACSVCPVAETCAARRQDRVAQFPAARPRKALPRRETVMLLLRCQGQVLLEQRPPTGVWGGLWSLPQFDSVDEAVAACRSRFGCELASQRPLQPLAHTFSHYALAILPVHCEARVQSPRAMEQGIAWLATGAALQAPIPAPVRTLLRRLNKND